MASESSTAAKARLLNTALKYARLAEGLDPDDTGMLLSIYTKQLTRNAVQFFRSYKDKALVGKIYKSITISFESKEQADE